MNFTTIFRLSFFLMLVLVFDITLAINPENAPGRNPDRIILNLAQDASTTLAVTWRTDTTVTKGFCELQVLPGGRINPENTKSFNVKTTSVKYEYEGEPTIWANQHSFVFTNLIPGTKYLYRVGVTGNWSEWLEFQLPLNDNNSFSFIYFGDPQTDIKSQWSRVVRKAYRVSPDCAFMLYGGDIINRGGRDVEWQEWFDAGSYIFSTVPQALTPGNHDYMNLAIDPHWKYQFNQPQNGPVEVKGTCFFSDYKNLRVISIDSAVEDELESSILALVLANNDKKWVIVTTHLPFYSTNPKRDNPHIRKHFQPILEKYGVDLVLTGHDHAYGRGVVSDSPGVKPSIVYVVSVSGPKQYENGKKDWMQKSGDHLQLFQEISIDNNELVYKAYSADGELFDQFKLSKKKDGSKKFSDLN